MKSESAKPKAKVMSVTGSVRAKTSAATSTLTKSSPKKSSARTKTPAVKIPAAKTSGGKLDVDAVVLWLRRQGTEKTRDGMARYAIPSDKAFGVTVGELRQYAKRLGRDHALALALWESGHYEARMLATFVDDPELVTAEQMEAWCQDFDSWAICDTACFHLFDRTPHAWRKVESWAKRKDEFVKRAAFALLSSLSVHDKKVSDEPFAKGLVLIEKAAQDDRNFVKKSVNWALRSIGKRSLALNIAAVEIARRLSSSTDGAPRWVGKDALRELTSSSVQSRLAKKAGRK